MVTALTLPALAAPDDVQERLAAGDQFNAYEMVRGGFIIAIGPVTDCMALAETLNAATAQFVVNALRAAHQHPPSAAPVGLPPLPHAGEILVSEFIEPLKLKVADLAEAIAVEPARLQAVIDGSQAIDGELDMRLGRYFSMSEGFFLRLQAEAERG